MALLHQWLLDETSGTTVADSVGSNTGTFTAGTLVSVGAGNGPGGVLADAGLDFTNAILDFANVAFTGNFTVCCWVKPDNTANAYVFDARDAFSDGVNLRLLGTGLFSYRVDLTNITSVATYATGTWQHIAVTHDGTTTRLYIDGVQTQTGSKSGYPDVAAIFRVGCRAPYDTPSDYLDGRLADLRIYDSDESANLAAIMDLDGGGGTDELTASGVDAGSPDSPTPSVGQIHGLGAGGVDSQAPVAYSGPIGQIHDLSEGGVDAGAVDLGSPTAGGPSTDILGERGLDAGAIEVGTPTLDAVVGRVWSIIGGADASLFTMNASTGRVSFLAAPDYAAPADFDADNDYELTIQVETTAGIDTQAVTVRVVEATGQPVLKPPVVSSIKSTWGGIG